MARLTLRTGFALVILLNTIGLTGCGTEDYAHVPVTNAWHQPLRVPVIYIVQPGDSLYSISWMYGLDFKQIAQDNHINSPYRIRVGQKLKLRPQGVANFAKKIVTPKATTAPATAVPATTPVSNKPVITANNVTSAPTPVSTTASPASPANNLPAPPVGTTVQNAGITWAWPAQGKIINGYTENGLNRGVDIAGKLGDSVVAAAAGRVVYAGNGLRGYGQLIIIKHNDDYLSAYAHNQKLLVKEGQKVTLGQQIATIGATETTSPMLHFEIRQNGKPTDPLKFLPVR